MVRLRAEYTPPGSLLELLFCATRRAAATKPVVSSRDVLTGIGAAPDSLEMSECREMTRWSRSIRTRNVEFRRFGPLAFGAHTSWVCLHLDITNNYFVRLRPRVMRSRLLDIESLCWEPRIRGNR